MGIAFMSFMGIKYGEEVAEDNVPIEKVAVDQKSENK
jgi:hypothetical protein